MLLVEPSFYSFLPPPSLPFPLPPSPFPLQPSPTLWRKSCGDILILLSIFSDLPSSYMQLVG